MSDVAQGAGWWVASDGKWYPPEMRAPSRATPTDVDGTTGTTAPELPAPPAPSGTNGGGRPPVAAPPPPLPAPPPPLPAPPAPLPAPPTSAAPAAPPVSAGAPGSPGGADDDDDDDGPVARGGAELAAAAEAAALAISANEAKQAEAPAIPPPPIREPSGWVAPGTALRPLPALPPPPAGRLEPATFEPLPPLPDPAQPGGADPPSGVGAPLPPLIPLNPDEYAPYQVKLTGTRDAPPPGVYSPGQSPRIRRRNRIVALLAVGILAAIGIAVGFAVADSGNNAGNAVTPGAPPSQNVNDPQKILTNAAQTAQAEGSFQVLATSSAPGQLSRVDVVVGVKGGSGTIQLNGASFRVVAVGQTLYVRGDAASLVTLGLSRTAAEKYADTWLEVKPTDGVLTSYFYLFNIQEVTEGLLALNPPLSAVGTSIQPTIVVTGLVAATPLVPSTAVGDKATVTVSNDSPYLPLQVSFAGTAKGLYTYTYSDWGVTVQPSAPAGAVPFSTAKAA